MTGCKLLGCVLNKVDMTGNSYYGISTMANITVNIMASTMDMRITISYG